METRLVSMKAIFLADTERGLMEIERREIPDTDVYYCARRRTPGAFIKTSDTPPDFSDIKKERWVMLSKPYGKRGFAVFMFDGED